MKTYSHMKLMVIRLDSILVQYLAQKEEAEEGIVILMRSPNIAIQSSLDGKYQEENVQTL